MQYLNNYIFVAVINFIVLRDITGRWVFLPIYSIHLFFQKWGTIVNNVNIFDMIKLVTSPRDIGQEK